MTREEFEEKYMEAIQGTGVIEITDFTAYQCDCGEDYCEGWRMETKLKSPHGEQT